MEASDLADQILALSMSAIFGAIGVLFVFWPASVIRTWAVASRWIYRGRYKRYLELWDRSPPGRFQRKFTHVSSAELLDQAYNDPTSVRFAVWYIRSLGAAILGLAALFLAAGGSAFVF